MFSQIVISSFAVAAVVLAQGSFTVNTATVAPATCQPYAITWTGGTAPFFPTITAAGQINTVLKRFPQTSDQSVLWTVDQPVGTTVTFAVRDATGTNQPSGISAPIVDGGSTACFGASSDASGSGSTTSAASSAPASSSSSSPATTSAPATTSKASSSSSKPSSTSSTAAAPSSTGNSASTVRGSSAVIAAIVGVAVAALA